MIPEFDDDGYLTPGIHWATWDELLDINYLQSIAPSLYNFAQKRAEQKTRYGGEIFPSDYPADISGITYLDFFQFDTRTNRSKGVIAIDLLRWNV
ncbi:MULTISPECIES: DUF6932 family protein [Aerosakkonema]|uniref:DUF6932 family protein n=1 Tax=Aerosakkonema TaxID=1246629 RepID=UPI0035B7F99B